MPAPNLKPLDLKTPDAAAIRFRLGQPVEQDGTAVRGIGHNELYEVLSRAADAELLLSAVVAGAVEIVAGSVKGVGRDHWWVVCPGLKDGDGRPYLSRLGVFQPEFRVSLTTEQRDMIRGAMDRHEKRRAAHQITADVMRRM